MGVAEMPLSKASNPKIAPRVASTMYYLLLGGLSLLVCGELVKCRGHILVSVHVTNHFPFTFEEASVKRFLLQFSLHFSSRSKLEYLS